MSNVRIVIHHTDLPQRTLMDKPASAILSGKEIIEYFSERMKKHV